MSKKMVKNGDLTQQRSPHDGRVIRIGLTEKGIRLRDRLTTMHQRHAEMLPQVGFPRWLSKALMAAPPRSHLDPSWRSRATAAATRRLSFAGARHPFVLSRQVAKRMSVDAES
jgi:hypothetical protein